MREGCANEKKAVSHATRARYAKAFACLVSNTREAKSRRARFPLHRELVEDFDSDVSLVHLALMRRTDFWALAPVEGKYAMAVAYHQKRSVAAPFARWLAATSGLIK